MKPDSLYNQGMRPLMYSEKDATSRSVGRRAVIKITNVKRLWNCPWKAIHFPVFPSSFLPLDAWVGVGSEKTSNITGITSKFAERTGRKDRIGTFTHSRGLARFLTPTTLATSLIVTLTLTRICKTIYSSWPTIPSNHASASKGSSVGRWPEIWLVNVS